ncbi:MAG: pilus assembly protein [Caldilineaceae bacterium]|nr:pilus assembly protein [Caldilineaceae bacterium]
MTIPMQGGRVRKFRERKDRELGQSLVEFALTLPMLLLLLLCTIDIGMGFKTYISLTNAAREGARWVSIYPADRVGALVRIANEAGGIELNEEPTFSPDGPYSAGERVTVTVQYNYQLLFGILDLPYIPFEASTTMVVLYGE